MRRPRHFVAALVLGAGLLIGAAPVGAATNAGSTTAQASSPAAACTAAQLVPSLGDVAIDQGVGSYGKLIRGKQAVVRLRLTLPTGCATASGQSITPTSASLKVEVPASSGTIFSFSKPYRPLAGKLTAAIQPDATSDPLFQVPGSTFQPANGGVEFDIAVTATVTYTRVSGGTTTTGLKKSYSTLGGQPITRTVEQRTNALRILVVPAGDASMPYGTQFTAAGQSAVVRGMTALARIYPVPDGTGDLKGDSGGIRYTIDAGLLDVGPDGLDLLDGSGHWCGTDASFNAVKGPLAAVLQDWNNANPDATADRALMVVDNKIGRISGPGVACDLGRAAIPAPDKPAVAAWVMAIPDTATTPSMTGGLMAMEIAHTFGAVAYKAAESPARTLPGTYHSLNTHADVTDPDTAVNLTTRSAIADDRSVMKLSGTGWNDTSVVLEKNDWEHLSCALGGETTFSCSVPDQAGTTDGIAAGPMFVLTGTTDGLSDTCESGGLGGGTCVTESYYNGAGDGEDGVAETAQDPESEYRLLYLDEFDNVLNDDGVGDPDDGFGVPVSTGESEHGADPDEAHGDPSRFLFSVAFPFTDPGNTTRIRLVRIHGGDTTVLYERNRTAAPIITRLTTPLSDSRVVFAWDDPSDDAGADTGSDIYAMDPDGSDVEQLTSSPADDTQPKISPDGRMVSFTRTPAGGGDSEVYLIWENRDACEAASPCSGATAFPNPTDLSNDPDHADADADWSPDGERLVFSKEIDPDLGVRNIFWLTYTQWYNHANHWFEGTQTTSFICCNGNLDAAGIDDSQTTMPVFLNPVLSSCDQLSLPKEPYLARIDAEFIRITAGWGTCAQTIQRGVYGTTPAAHAGFALITALATDGHDDREPVWSQDGTYFAFTRSTPGGATDIWQSTVSTTIQYDGSVRGRQDTLDSGLNFAQRLTDGSSNPAGRRDASHPTYAPDDQTIAFTNDWLGDRNIGRVDRDLGSVNQLTTDPADDHDPAFDPWSGRLLFASDRDGGVDRIFRMDGGGGNVLALPTDPAAQRGEEPSWYPRAPQSRLLVARATNDEPARFDLFTMNPDGSDLVQLTLNGTANQDGVWSPDARHIAYSGFFDTFARSDIYVMDDQGLGSVNLTAGLPDESFHPSYSPDGRRIAFETSGNIWVMDADGSHKKQLTFESEEARSPSWAPDGSRIAYSQVIGPREHIRTMLPDGTGMVQLTSGDSRNLNPAWSPDSTSIAFATGPLLAVGQGFVGTDIRTMDAITGATLHTYTNTLHEVPPEDDRGPSYDFPVYSPDGLRLAWQKGFPCLTTCSASLNATDSQALIETANIDGSEVVQRTIDNRMFGASWSTGEDQVYLSAQMDDPEDAVADLFFDCGDGGPTHVIAAAVPPVEVEEQIARFQVTFDPARACGDGTPKIFARVNNGTDISDPSEPQGYISDPKPPTPGIASPVQGGAVVFRDPLPLAADTEDPEQGALPPSAFVWKVDGHPAGSGKTLDVPPPAGGWPLGKHTATLTVTDGDGKKSVTTTTWYAGHAFRWVDPTVPDVNEGVAGTVIRLHFKLEKGLGLGILWPSSSPRSQRVTCGDGDLGNQLVPGSQYRTRPFGKLGLTYDAATKTYTYAWKTRPEWGKPFMACRQFQLRLDDGVTYVTSVHLAPPPP